VLVAKLFWMHVLRMWPNKLTTSWGSFIVRQMSIYEIGTLYASNISTRSGALSISSATGSIDFNNGGITNVDTINGVDIDNIVNGAASSTLNAVARYSDTTGKSIKNSGVVIDDTNNITGIASLTSTSATITTLNSKTTNDLVTGPASVTANQIATYNDTTGKIIQAVPVTIDASGNVANVTSLSATSATITTLNSKTTNDLVTGPASVTATQVATYSGTTGKVIQAVPLTIDSSGNIANAGTLNGKTIADLVTGPASVTSTQLAAFSGTTGKVITNVPITVDASGNITNAGTLNGKTIADLVTGPASVTATQVATYSGTTGKIIQAVPVTIDSSGNVTGVSQLSISNASTTAASATITVGTFVQNLFINSVTTTDATTTVLRGYTASTASTTYSLCAEIVALRTSPTIGSATIKIEGTFRNIGGTVTQVGSTIKTINADNASWNAGYSISGTTINLSVTGAASETVKWATKTWVSTLA
jgi:hypothetical protein